jgi:imidazolonepropionase-like amidohydrolase
MSLRGISALAALCIAITSSSAAQQSTALIGITVIDATDPSPRPHQTVLVVGNRIAAVGPVDSVTIPANARLIDGAGKFVIPGLWDMHVHTVFPGGRQVLPLYLANGVTSVRDLAGDWTQILAWRAEIANGALVGPRIMASGPYLEGGDVPIVHFSTKTPDEARAAIDTLLAMGVDVIKLHGQLSRETYLAAALYAKRLGLRVAGHVPTSVGVMDASDAGVGSIEHALQIPVSCTPAESTALVPRFPVQRVVGRCSSQDMAPLFAHLVRNNTWVVPTLVAAYEVAHWPKTDLPGDAFADYLPDTLRTYVASIFPMLPDIPSDADVVGMQLFAKRLTLVSELHRAGVGVLPGTDAPLRNSPPGFGLHEELRLMVQGGMRTFDVLRAATLEPARYFGMLDSLGTVAPGKVADLVVLSASPLENIENTRKIDLVLSNGRIHEPTKLLRAGHAGSRPDPARPRRNPFPEAADSPIRRSALPQR